MKDHKKLQASRFVQCRQSCLERSGCDTFWTGDKKQFNLGYLLINDSMTFL